MTTTKITPKELLTHFLYDKSGYRFLTLDKYGYVMWTAKPALFYDNEFDIDILAYDGDYHYIPLDEYLIERNLEIVGLGLNEMFKLKPLVKITPKEIENVDDEDEGLVTFVTIGCE